MIKKNIYIMYIIVFLQGMVFYSPISTLFRQDRGLSLEQIFLLQAILSFTIIVFEVPFGYIGDKIGYKKTIILSNTILFISKIVFYKSHSFQLFFLESILFGISAAATSGCDIALLYESKGNESGEKIFGRYSAVGSIGFLLSSLISTYFISKSFDLTAFATIIPHGICVIATLFLKDVKNNISSEKSNKSFLHEIKVCFSKKGIIALFIFVLLISLISQIVHSTTVFLNQVQYSNSGIDIKFYGLISAIIQIVGILAAQTYRFTNKFGQKNVLISLLAFINMGLLALIFTNNPLISILCMMIISGSFTMCTPIITTIQNQSIKNNRATMLSIYSLFGNIVGSLVNILIGRSADSSLKMAFIVSLFMVMFSTLGILVYLYKYKYTYDIKEISNSQ